MKSIIGCTVCLIQTQELIGPLQNLASRLTEAASDLKFQITALEMTERDEKVTVVLRGDSAKAKPVDLVGDIEVKSVLSDPAQAEIRSMAYSYISNLGG